MTLSLSKGLHANRPLGCSGGLAICVCSITCLVYNLNTIHRLDGSRPPESVGFSRSVMADQNAAMNNGMNEVLVSPDRCSFPKRKPPAAFSLFFSFTHSCEWDNNIFVTNEIWFSRQAGAWSAIKRKTSVKNAVPFLIRPPKQAMQDVWRLI